MRRYKLHKQKGKVSNSIVQTLYFSNNIRVLITIQDGKKNKHKIKSKKKRIYFAHFDMNQTIVYGNLKLNCFAIFSTYFIGILGLNAFMLHLSLNMLLNSKKWFVRNDWSPFGPVLCGSWMNSCWMHATAITV